MNKTQLVTFIVAVLLFCGGFAFYGVRQKHYSAIQAQSYAAASDLINSNHTNLFVGIGTGIKRKWDQFAKLPARIESVQIGDEPAPIGDGQANSRAFFANEAGERLAIRLRWDEQQQKFHVLGFWTPKN